MTNTIKVWDQVERMASNERAINLGQGCPDFEPPAIIKDALIEVAKNPSCPSVHQYARRYGHLRLVKILAEMYSTSLGVEIDPLKNIIITFGSQHAFYCAVRNILTTKDEVIMFEPFFTLYDSIIQETGASVIYFPMKLNSTSASKNPLNSYTFDREELKSKFNKRTKLFVLNNPNNPSGKVFTRDELEYIAELCIENNVTVISDEVYFRLVHRPYKHISIASLPGMWDKTITLGSAGKCFSVTGWRIGWCVAAEHLIDQVAQTHRTSAYSCPTPLQEAVAIAFEREKELGIDGSTCFRSASNEVLEKFKRLEKVMTPVGFKPVMPQAGFFFIVDISNIEFKENKTSDIGKDVQFAEWMFSEYGITSVPMGVFCSAKNQRKGSNFIRLCCYKSEATISRAEVAFKTWKDNLEKRNSVQK